MSSSHDGGSTAPSSVSDECSTSPRANRRLGYIRPQPQPFSSSARNRSSVMALGRIDHLQHRFARTQTLAGRNGAYQVKTKSNRGERSSSPYDGCSDNMLTPLSLYREEDDEEELVYNPVLVPLPPSPVKRHYVGRLSKDINPKKLRRGLEQNLKACSQQLCAYDIEYGASKDVDTTARAEALIDLANALTICIRAARTYSTSVPSYHSLDSSFAVFRDDALELLSHLKKIFERHGAGGFSNEEKLSTTKWIQEVGEYLESENTRTIGDAMEWAQPELWLGKEEERHCSFLRFYDPLSDHIGDTMDEDFLQKMSTGVRLCQIFNAVVHRSYKPFGLITRFHEDTAIRYRVLENLRFWHAAVSYRFGLQLDDFDPNQIYDFTESGRRQLLEAISRFCRAAMQEMVKTLSEEFSEESEDDLIEALQISELKNPYRASSRPTSAITS